MFGLAKEVTLPKRRMKPCVPITSETVLPGNIWTDGQDWKYYRAKTKFKFRNSQVVGRAEAGSERGSSGERFTATTPELPRC
jgi:hypothetical protein